MVWKTVLCVQALLAAVATAQATIHLSSNSPFPMINVTLTPNLENGTNLTQTIDGKIVFPANLAENDSVVLLPITMASTPSAQYTTDDISAWDAFGALELAYYDGDGPSAQPTRFWTAQRDATGPITVQFQATPRKVNESSTVGPLFDIRANENGLLGSMWALVPMPPNDTAEYQWNLQWDNTNTPRGTEAVWTWGEGTNPGVVTGYSDIFTYTFWAVGALHSYPDSSASGNSSQPLSPDFGMYWFQEPPFAIDDTAVFIDRFFNYSSIFWGDSSNQPYRVFIRHNEDSGTGGTALYRSFTFGWHNDSQSPLDLQLLLAHEMTHNWPNLYGADASVSQYSEGMAEYYSLRLLWRNQQISAATYLDEMNSRLHDYYTNAFVNTTNDEAYAMAWENRTAQKIPYGRGLIYLTNIDAHIRARTNGTENLDNLALDMLSICNQDKNNCTNDEFLSQLTNYIGSNATAEYDTVAAGGDAVIKPVDNSLGPCFDVVQSDSTTTVYQWQLKVGQDINSTTCLI